MRYLTVLLIVCSHLPCWGQVTVNNQEPFVTMESKQYLYVGFDNPVFITTGKIKSLKVSTDNGTIRSTNKNGSYIIKPDRSGTATITLSGSNYEKEFIFEVWTLSMPHVRLTGEAGHHGIIDFKRSTGITTYNPPVDVDLGFRIDSFTIQLTDSIDTVRHINKGAL